MERLDKINEYVEMSTMILIVNNNSKLLLNNLFNYIYKNYPKDKIKFEKRKGLMRKLIKIKNKLIRIDFDFNKVQFNSSTSPSRLHTEILTLKSYLFDNNSKLLFKTDLSSNKNLNINELYHGIYSSFDLILLIDKKDIKILRFEKRNMDHNPWQNYYNKKERIIDISQLLRSTKLKQIQNKMKFYEKGSS